MLTRRDAFRMLASMPLGMAALTSAATRGNRAPVLAPGKPSSAERLSRIEEFRRRADGVDRPFDARRHESDWVMPYRLFRPHAGGKLPLVVYLHGSGGLGDDNEKQLRLGNIFGTRLWALAENQHRFPCYVLAPQTDRGWIRYDPAPTSDGIAKPIPGLGDGARLALEIIDGLKKELAIDDRRIYITGQSMGGAGVWNMLTHRPGFFAAAVICCGSASTEDGTGSIGTPLWNFHGESDKTVPVSISRRRIAARRKAGGHPLSTEYEGVDHNVWQWAFTEPELLPWVFAQHRGA